MTFHAGSIARPGNSITARSLFAAARNFLRCKRQRDDLACLSDYQLEDIGLTRADVTRAWRNAWIF